MGSGSSPRPAGRIVDAVGRRAAWLSGQGMALGWTAAEWLADRVVGVVRRGRRLVEGGSAVRARRQRRLGRRPLANLFEVHPDARLAYARELGLRSVSLDQIAGTAVAGPAQRGGDFLPRPAFRSPSWRSRWHRLRAAAERLAVLPPVELVNYDGRYWVTDGHDRVAAALYVGQREIDAVVTGLVPPDGSPDEAPASLAEIVADSRAVRATGSGLSTRSAPPGATDEAGSALDTVAGPTEAPGEDR